MLIIIISFIEYLIFPRHHSKCFSYIFFTQHSNTFSFYMGRKLKFRRINYFFSKSHSFCHTKDLNHVFLILKQGPREQIKFSVFHGCCLRIKFFVQLKFLRNSFLQILFSAKDLVHIHIRKFVIVKSDYNTMNNIYFYKHLLVEEAQALRKQPQPLEPSFQCHHLVIVEH